MPRTSFTNLRETARGENVCPGWVGSVPALHNLPWNPLPHPAPSSHCAQCRALTHIKVQPGSPYAPGVTWKLALLCGSVPCLHSCLCESSEHLEEVIPVRLNRGKAERGRVEAWPPLGSIPTLSTGPQQDKIACVYNFSTQEAKARES